jgi:hypothetical protein
MEKQRIFTHILIGVTISFIVFSLAVFLPNFSLVWAIVNSPTLLSGKLTLFISLYGAIQTNFTFLAASYTVLISILFGLNVVLLIHLVHSRRVGTAGKNAVVSMGGLVSGILGVGCAACGTFILSAVLGLVGAAGLLTLLPLGGEEFGIVGVLLLAYTTYALIKKIREPNVCSV